jgi:hypothetical protein
MISWLFDLAITHRNRVIPIAREESMIGYGLKNELGYEAHNSLTYPQTVSDCAYLCGTELEGSVSCLAAQFHRLRINNNTTVCGCAVLPPRDIPHV